jgi:hypothetical protein
MREFRQMRSGFTFIGLLVVAFGWMGLLLGGIFEALSALPRLRPTTLEGIPFVGYAAGAILCGLLMTGGGLWLGTRERPTKRRHPRAALHHESFQPKTVLRTELLADGRTKYHYEGGETEIV